MEKTMKKSTFIAWAVVAAALVVIGSVIVGVFAPRDAKLDVYIWSPKDKFDAASYPALEMPAGRDFKILQLSDLQLWSNGADNDEALDIATRTAQLTDPDVIVLAGDNVSGIQNDVLFKKVVKCMENIGKPWTFVFGNHDAHEGRATRRWQAAYVKKNARHCLFSAGPSNIEGVGNHVLNVKNGDKIVHSLMLLDSGAKVRLADGTTSYSYVDFDQIEWYRWCVAGLKSVSPDVKTSAYFHIAPPEFATAIKDLTTDENGVITIPESMGFGLIGERVACPTYNSGFFDAAKAAGTDNIFVAHDHANTASVVYRGVRMTYGLKTGPSPRPWNDAKAYGGTLISIGADGAVNSIEHKIVKQL